MDNEFEVLHDDKLSYTPLSGRWRMSVKSCGPNGQTYCVCCALLGVMGHWMRLISLCVRKSGSPSDSEYGIPSALVYFVILSITVWFQVLKFSARGVLLELVV